MRKSIIIVILALPLLSFNMRPFLFVRKDTKIDTLNVLVPVSSISVINRANTQHYDSLLSRQTSFNTSAILQKSFYDIVPTKYFSSNLFVQSKLLNWVLKVNKEIENERQAKKYQLPDSILNLFDTSKINFVFCTNNIGFRRTRENLVKTDQTNNIAVALFGFGVGRQPLESAASMSCFIVDLKKKNILYFSRDHLENEDPTDKNVIKLQLTKAITHYFM